MADNDELSEHDGAADMSTLDALQLDGKGLDGLEDAEEQSLPEGAESDGEDVKGFANVQSANRTTFEQMQQGAPPPSDAVPDRGQIGAEDYRPSEPDNTVEARFENPFPPQTIEELADAVEEDRETRQFIIDEDEPVPVARPEDPALDATRGNGQGTVAPDQAGEIAAPVEAAPVEPSDPEDPVITTAQPAKLTVEPALGVEGQMTRLVIQAATADSDGGGDVISAIQIAGVPVQFVIVDADGNPVGQLSGGVWTLNQPTTADLDNLFLSNLAADEDGDFGGGFTLSVSVVTREPNGSTALASSTLSVWIEPVADAPGLSVADSAGMENSWIPLSIDVVDKDVWYENGVDVDHSETQIVYISGLPAGAQLNHGAALDADLTLAGVTIPAGAWMVESADLADLKIMPPADNSRDFDLTVWAASTEELNGDVAVTGPQTIQVDVGIVAPTASGSGAGNEDEWANLSLSAAVNAADGTEELRVYIEDLPSGSQLAWRDGTPVPVNADGRYEITGRLDDVMVRWDPVLHPHRDDDVAFRLAAEVRDGDLDVDSSEVQAAAPDFNRTEVPVSVTIRAVADAPTLSASAATGVEDKWIDLSIQSALVDVDGSESLSLTITGPAGFTLSAGTETAPGVWALAPADLVGLKVLPDRDSDADFQLTVTATATEAAEGDQVAVKTAVTTTTLSVTVFSDADIPFITVDDVVKRVDEDTFYNLRTSIGDRFAVEGMLGEAGADEGAITSPDGSENLFFEIVATHPGSRIWVDADGDGQMGGGEIATLSVGVPYEVTAADLFAGRVHVGAATDWAGADPIHFDLRTKAVDTNDDSLAAGQDRSTVAYSEFQRLSLIVDPVHDSATLVAMDSGHEDQAGGITVAPVVTFSDTDFSERPVGMVTFTSTDADLAGGSFTLNGQPVTVTLEDGTYSWQVPASAFVQAGNTWTLTGLRYFPDEHLAEDVDYSISVDTQDAAGGSVRTLTSAGFIAIEAVADAPALIVAPAAGMENTAISLSVSSVLTDLDGSESLAVYIGDVPAGATLNHGERLNAAVTLEDGTVMAAGTWRIDPTDLPNLTLTPATNSSDDLALKVWAVSTESRNGDVAVTGPSTLRVDIGLVAPSASGSGDGLENSWTQLSLSANANAADGSETLRVFIEDLPPGMQLANAANGTGTFTQVTYLGSDGQEHTGYEITGQLDSVYARWAGANSDADFTLSMRAIAYDRDASNPEFATAITDATAPDSADVVVPVHVIIRAEADAPILSVAKAVGVEDKFAVLRIDSALADTDGSETLAVYVQLPVGSHPGLYLADAAGNPVGTLLAAPELQADGTTEVPAGFYKLTQAEAAELRIFGLTPESNANFTVNIRSVATENGTDGQVASAVAVTTHNQLVTIFGDADKPSITVDTDVQTIKEDAFFNLRSVIDGYDPVSGTLNENGSLWDTLKSPDGSETLSFQVVAREAGSRLWIDANNNGIVDQGEVQTFSKDQSRTVSLADLMAGKVHLGGGANWASESDYLNFDLRAVSQEADRNTNSSALSGTGLTRNGTNYSDFARLQLKVEAVADPVTIGSTALGNEDTLIALSPRFTLQDPDGSEKLVGDVEVIVAKADLHGTLLRNGTAMVDEATGRHDGGDTWIFRFPVSDLSAVGGSGSVSELRTLQFQPEEHSASDLVYRVSVTSEDVNGDQLVTTTPAQTLTVLAVADAPEVAVGVGGVVTGNEDSRINLGLSANLVDTDGSETLARAELSSVDEGWTIGYVNGAGIYSAAQDMGGGRWVLDPTRLSQVVVTPPADRHFTLEDDVRMDFHAWSRETEADAQVAVREAESSTSFQIVVNAVADQARLLLTHARTDEDVAVKLDIRPALTDTDGSESLTILIGGVPAGASLVNAAGEAVGELVDTYWRLDPSQLADLYFLPKPDSNVDAELTVIARSTEASNGHFADTVGTLRVMVKGVSDGAAIPAERLDEVGNLLAWGTEDQTPSGDAIAGALIDPGFGTYGTLDADGSETLSLVLRDLPDHVSIEMTAGNEQYLKFIGGGKWSVEPDYLGEVRLRVPHNYANNDPFSVTVDLITTEDDGHSMAVTKVLKVTVDAVADTPNAGLSASVAENSWSGGAGIPITITASPTDLTDGVERITAITLDINPAGLGLPEGTVLTLQLDGTTYTVGAGIEIVLTEANGLLDQYYANGKVQGITLHGVPEDWAKDVPVTVTATSTDINGSTATRTVNGKVAIAARAEEPSVAFEEPTVTGAAGSTLDLGLTAYATDADGSETLYFIVEGVPNGVALSQGYNNGDGTWTVPYGAGSAPLTVTSVYTGTAILNFHPVVVDHDPDGGSHTGTWDAIPVTITFTGEGTGWGDDPAGPEAPVLGGALSTNEDTGFTLAGLNVSASGDATVSAVVLTGVPAGAKVSGGYYNHVNGTWTVPADSLDGITITPPADFSGQMQIGLRAVATLGGLYAISDESAMAVTVAPVTDGATFTLSANGGQPIVEDMGDIPLSILLAEKDRDFSESLVDGVLEIRVTAGAGQLIGADGNAIAADPDGVYRLAITDFGEDGRTSLSGLSFRPPAQFAGDIRLGFSTSVQDGAADPKQATGTLNFKVAPVADVPVIHAADLDGNEDTAIALNVQIGVKDLVGTNPYGSESLAVTIGGIPAGAVVQGALNNNDGTWTVKSANLQLVNDPELGWVAQLINVRYLPPRDDSTDLDLTVTAFTSENGVKNEIASATGTFHVTVHGIADQPTIDPQSAAGSEDVELALNLNAQLIDLSETLFVTITGVPADARFTDGNATTVGDNQGGGTWVLPQETLASLHFLGPVYASGSWTMVATATSVDDATTATSNAMSFTITLAGVANQPVLVIGDLTGPDDAYHAAGDEDTLIALSISAQLIDLDGSESLSLTIADAPVGTIFVTAGNREVVASSDGKWHLNEGEVAGLRMRPPENWFGEVALTITATSAENAGGSTASISDELTVLVQAVNDAPDVSLFTTAQGIPGGVLAQPIHVLPGEDGLAITDVDGTMLSGMSVQIQVGAAFGDTLALSGVDIRFAPSGDMVVGETGIVVSYDGHTQRLSFTGAGSYEDYANIAQGVILSNSTGTLQPGERTFGITIYDEQGAPGSVAATATVGSIESGSVQLTGAALGEIRWSDDGSAELDTMVVRTGDPVSFIDFGTGTDALVLQRADGTQGDWLFHLSEDGTVVATSDTDGNFIVHLDHGQVQQVDETGIVFNGDASGRIEFDDGNLQFNNLDRLTI